MSNNDDDPFIRRMKELGLPVTRERWISMNYGIDIPDPWTWEHEEELPPSLRVEWQEGMDDGPPQPQ